MLAGFDLLSVLILVLFDIDMSDQLLACMWILPFY